MTADIRKQRRKPSPEVSRDTSAAALKRRLISEIATGHPGTAEALRAQLAALQKPADPPPTAATKGPPADTRSYVRWEDENGILHTIEMRATPEARDYFEHLQGQRRYLDPTE